MTFKAIQRKEGIVLMAEKAKNENLNKAKKEKNDEFYTRLSDIENELKNYKKHFEGKIVFCNCDDPEWSNFWKYFKLNFEHLKLRKLISTHYIKEGSSYKLEYDGKETIKTALEGNGDFRSEECINILKECDIVTTNPPFSLFRPYLAQLIEYKKQFLIIGNQNAIKYKETFPLIKENKVWLGINPVKEFLKPDGTTQKFGNICWYTNLEHSKRNEEMILYKEYNPEEYPKYDNYDAIDVSKTKNIPMDYEGVMGVPISFMDKFNPKQFKIIGELNHGCDNEYDFEKPVINGIEKFPRILIQRIKGAM